MLCVAEPSVGLRSGDHVRPCGVVAKAGDDASRDEMPAVAAFLRDDRNGPLVDDRAPDDLEHWIAGALVFGRPMVLPALVIAYSHGDVGRPRIVALAPPVHPPEVDRC